MRALALAGAHLNGLRLVSERRVALASPKMTL